jgi:hypothetical protein
MSVAIGAWSTSERDLEAWWSTRMVPRESRPAGGRGVSFLLDEAPASEAPASYESNVCASHRGQA